MENIFVEFLPPWVETGLQPAFYDKESGTVLQQVARMYAKVNWLIKMFNKFSKDTTNFVNDFVDSTNREINRFEDAVDTRVTNFERSTTETVNEYIGKFVALKDFVDDYFDNLDVQQEINNKLDDMLAQGTLQEIITTYIQSNVAWTFDTVADMKLATNLINGSFAQTLGFYSVNDGGGALYKITNTGTANEMDIIAIGGTLYAHLNEKDNINIKQLGAKGNNTDDDSTIFAYGLNNYKNIEIPNATYLLSNEMVISNSGIKVKGVNKPILSIASSTNGFKISNCNNIEFDNLDFKAQAHYDSGTNPDNHMLRIFNANNIIVKNCVFEYGRMGLTIGKANNVIVKNNEFHHFKGWGLYIGADATFSTTYSIVNQIRVENNISHDGTYDGIKMTGLIYNAIIEGNECYGNTRDGIDYAGFSAQYVKILNNFMHDNTLDGIEFKLLDRSEYPLPEEYTNTVFNNIEFGNNSIIGNKHAGISCQNAYSTTAPHNIICHDNIVEIPSNAETSSNGIRFAGINATTEKAIIIYNNTVTNNSNNDLYGIRLTNTKYLILKDNLISGYFRYALYIDYNASFNTENGSTTDYNLIENNMILNVRTGSNAISSGDSNITHTYIENNILDSVLTSYLIAPNLVTVGAVMTNNRHAKTFDTIPTGRTTKGIIYPATDPITAGCFGWIGKSNSASADYAQYIPITV